MKIHLDTTGPHNVFESYDSGDFCVKERHYSQCLAISPSRLEQRADFKQVNDFSYDALAFVLEWEPEVVLLGTGPTLTFPDMRLLRSFHQLGIGCDVMDSAAACRTYNILVGEGRSVAAIILPP